MVKKIISEVDIQLRPCRDWSPFDYTLAVIYRRAGFHNGTYYHEDKVNLMEEHLDKMIEELIKQREEIKAEREERREHDRL